MSGGGAAVLHDPARLPPDFPPWRVLRCVPDKREPGHMVFAIESRRTRSSAASDVSFLVSLDRAGRIDLCRSPGRSMRRLRNGNLLSSFGTRLEEIDPAGGTVRRWHTRTHPDAPTAGSIAIDWDGGFISTTSETAEGTLLLVGQALHPVEAYPTSEMRLDAPQAPATVLSEVVVEIDPGTGKMVRTFDLFDILDPFRVCYDSLSPPMRGAPGPAGQRDWSHANGVFYDGRDDSFLVSLRHQDCIVKIARRSGAIVWILGDHDGWRDPWRAKLLAPSDGLVWPYHQHDPSITPDGTVLCFDNGNHRAIPPKQAAPFVETRSRAVEYAVGEGTMTVRQIWSFGGEAVGNLACGFVSGALHLPRTGNRFITFGGVARTEDGIVAPGPQDADRLGARLYEVTPEGEIVFEAAVMDEAPSGYRAFIVFRAEHLPG